MKHSASLLLAALLMATSVHAQIATQTVVDDFNSRMATLPVKSWADVFDTPLSQQQRQALQVLYAYMPLPDIADYPGSYFLENVDIALQARSEMPWGEQVPDREFRHFVLPVRVNNEALDGHRAAFYHELKPRIEGLTMQQAILEVNHWCHEKVTYQPSDSRTHSPLASVSSAIGRCGEESTFTVAALRAVGIPARQVYTPRWAHTDDNHAWVEAWADGQWWFLGACEPEPVLNLGWFNAPAARGMLMNSRVFGRYDGPEEPLLTLPGYTDINVTANYAPVDTLKVTVLNHDGSPAAGSIVDFRLYNYAELYPIATKTADHQGRASLLAGKGDLIVWASLGNRYALAQVTVGQNTDITLTLNHTPQSINSYEWTLTPPPTAKATVTPPAAMVEENNHRKAMEDSIRLAYTATFMSTSQARALADSLSLDPDRLWPIMADTRGNHAVVAEYLQSLPPTMRRIGLSLLESISIKDRSDVTAETLRDHTPQRPVAWDTDIHSPRILNELLTPWRTLLASEIPDQDHYRNDPSQWVEWVNRNISICADWAPATVRMSPQAVWQGRVADAMSRNIFFVASARAMGIPSRIDPVNERPQWRDDSGLWHDATFSSPYSGFAPSQKALLTLKYDPDGQPSNPAYYTHFTLSAIDNGRPRLLNYPEDNTRASAFASPVEIDCGPIMLLSGQRLADGSVMARAEIATLAPGSENALPLQIRHAESSLEVIGSLDAELNYHDFALNDEKSLLSTTGRGYYVLALVKPDHEPSNHVVRDIAAIAQQFEAIGRPIIILCDNPDALSFATLPSTAVLGSDPSATIANALAAGLETKSLDYPTVVIADTFNRIVLQSQGYTIGIGERIATALDQLEQ